MQWCPPSDHIEAPLDLDEMHQWIQLGPVQIKKDIFSITYLFFLT